MSKEKALKLINEYLAKQEPKKIELNMVKSVESNSKKSESLYTQGVKKIFSAIGEIQISYSDT